MLGSCVRSPDAAGRRRRKPLSELLRFPSSKSGEGLATLKEYAGRMKPGQKEIYYIAADSLAAAANAPFVEQLIKRDLEARAPAARAARAWNVMLAALAQAECGGPRCSGARVGPASAGTRRRFAGGPAPARRAHACGRGLTRRGARRCCT